MSHIISKQGDDLTLHIPKPYADQLHWDDATEVEARIIDGKLVLEAVTVADSEPTLEQLLAGITPENLHQEIATGRAVGNESW